MSWQIYIIEADDGSLYTGVTTDVERRFSEHCSGKRGARYFGGRRPVQVVYTELAETRSAACKREAAIKKLSRPAKLRLLQHPLSEEPR